MKETLFRHSHCECRGGKRQKNPIFFYNCRQCCFLWAVMPLVGGHLTAFYDVLDRHLGSDARANNCVLGSSLRLLCSLCGVTPTPQKCARGTVLSHRQRKPGGAWSKFKNRYKIGSLRGSK